LLGLEIALANLAVKLRHREILMSPIGRPDPRGILVTPLVVWSRPPDREEGANATFIVDFAWSGA
jgi:hypothetical protein